VVTSKLNDAPPSEKLAGSALRMPLALQNQGGLWEPVRYSDRMQRVALLT